ncbi:hypothetical protein PspLS_08171 [Pyricularia sp. CBS 133598]|nr:hypothetical protein PspLS_08171 [Pyricularia sp. CBS 133598]
MGKDEGWSDMLHARQKRPIEQIFTEDAAARAAAILGTLTGSISLGGALVEVAAEHHKSTVGLDALEFDIVQIGQVMDVLLTRESTSPDEVFRAALPLAGIELDLEEIETHKDLVMQLRNHDHIGTNILACCEELERDGECGWVPFYDTQEPGLPSIGRAESSSCHAFP